MIFTELRTTQRQTQALSPRLQHAVRLLQMSSLDFSAMVHDMLGRNPFLEQAEAADGLEEGDPPAGPQPEMDGRAQDVVDAADTPLSSEATMPDDREIWNAEGGASAGRAEDGEFSALELTPVPCSLHQHLRSQLNVLKLPERDHVLACIVAESVDEDGYLRTPLEELAPLSGLEPPADMDEMQIALKRVQALDPLGVGARSVAESLWLQLPAISCEQTRQLAECIVRDHIELLAARDMQTLAERLGVTPAEAEAVCLRLRRLDPRPGWRFSSSQAAYIVPDVLTSKVGGQWRVQLNPAVIPKVRMNQIYAELFQRHRRQGDGEMASHLQEARWTLRNIDQRFATILDVAAAIVRRQRHFLEFGAMAMKPLGLKEIADEVGIHESTVSRVTNNKFIATPSGVYELKYFFSRAIVSSNGSACSGTAIRGLIKDIIDAENPASPLSDADITRLLARQGLVVARRTVTKYRQMLKIDAVERRRQHA
ncbi:RNA polymerase factor sigma-54 [Roseateles sp. DB2]|uniref:RNA polymerase factor sigma-54 n=1 Tax=Roseateles sp. DB2 TaxID=3453717 RepID=UPI003EED9A61